MYILQNLQEKRLWAFNFCFLYKCIWYIGCTYYFRWSLTLGEKKHISCWISSICRCRIWWLLPFGAWLSFNKSSFTTLAFSFVMERHSCLVLSHSFLSCLAMVSLCLWDALSCANSMLFCQTVVLLSRKHVLISLCIVLSCPIDMIACHTDMLQNKPSYDSYLIWKNDIMSISYDALSRGRAFLCKWRGERYRATMVLLFTRSLFSLWSFFLLRVIKCSWSH